MFILSYEGFGLSYQYQKFDDQTVYESINADLMVQWLHPLRAVESHCRKVTGGIRANLKDMSQGVLLDVSFPVTCFQHPDKGIEKAMQNLLGKATDTIRFQSDKMDIHALSTPQKQVMTFYGVLTVRKSESEAVVPTECRVEGAAWVCEFNWGSELAKHKIDVPSLIGIGWGKFSVHARMTFRATAS